MTKEQILKTITSNGMREITEERCYQAMNEFAIGCLNEVIKTHKFNVKMAVLGEEIFLTIDEIVLDKIKSIKNETTK